ncbi:TRAP transporter large permease [Acuticoccus kandeliae]|uniref:TRAP transporter large permease n=1 Tax=Acuticoccus kandeliae TaxID=2073160 RepID=UPI001B3BC809|nr:TRAP transporter large permease [Acuticoccus kandeliae]
MMVALITLVLIIALICLGMPVGFAAGVASVAGAAWLFGDILDPRVATMLARTSLDKMNDFLLLAIPFFLFAGRLMNTGGITDRLFNFVAVLTQPVRGGLGHANVLGSVFFAGMSGSATADAVGLGQIEFRAMTRAGYNHNFSAGITAASSLISPILPPSIVLVAYAVQAQVSVAALFFAAIIPGILMAGLFMGWVAYSARVYGFPAGSRVTLLAIWESLRPAFLAFMTPIIIMTGIYAGFFTPTEAAAVAALYALIITTLVYREIGLRRVLEELRGTLIDTAVIMLIIAFTSVLGVLLIRSGVPGELASFFASITDSPRVLLLLLLVLWLIVGCFMAQTPAVLILTPILMPIVQRFGINEIHFGIVMTLALTLGLLTPPVGMVLYALIRVTGLRFDQLVRASFPYIVMLLGLTVVLVLFPDISLWLPRLLGFRAAG